MKIDPRYSLAGIVLALLGAGCAGEPQRAGQSAAVQPTKVAAPVAPVAINDEDTLECRYTVPPGTAIHQWICLAASEHPATVAKDDTPECGYLLTTGMIHRWFCSTPREKAWLAVPLAIKDGDPLECWHMVPAGTAIHKWICFNASQDPPAVAKDDDPLECEYAAPAGTMLRRWSCITASDKALQRQRGMADFGQVGGY